MKKVRGECGFSTPGCSLLCLTLTGVSGKSWLSCKEGRGRSLIGLSAPRLSRTGYVCFTLSNVPPRRRPTCCILFEVARDLLQDHVVHIRVSFHFKAGVNISHVEHADIPQLLWPLGLLLWSPTFFQAFLDHSFTSSLHYWNKRKTVSWT